MIRLFVAVELPGSVRAQLTGLARPIAGARWVDADNLHITLRFIGEVDEGTARDIDDELARIDVPAFTIDLAGLGEFGSNGRVRALWAGVVASEPLARLQSKVERAVVRAGLPPEGRKFRPHVTLARLRAARTPRITEFLADGAGFRAGRIPVPRFVLMSSVLGHGGSAYTAEVAYPLAGGDLLPDGGAAAWEDAPWA